MLKTAGIQFSLLSTKLKGFDVANNMYLDVPKALLVVLSSDQVFPFYEAQWIISTWRSTLFDI
jgi:hypothetical protein